MVDRTSSVIALAAFLFLCSPSTSIAQDSNTSIYKQCQDACSGNGLSCVNKCLAESRTVTDTGNNTAVAVGEGDAAGAWGDTYDSRERIANEREAIKEGEPREFGDPAERERFRRR